MLLSEAGAHLSFSGRASVFTCTVYAGVFVCPTVRESSGWQNKQVVGSGAFVTHVVCEFSNNVTPMVQCGVLRQLVSSLCPASQHWSSLLLGCNCQYACFSAVDPDGLC